MSLARTSPSLRRRIITAQSGPTTISARDAGVRPPAVRSYTERYRGTEYETPARPAPVTRAPRVSDGRLFVLVSGIASTVVAAVTAVAVLG